MHVLYIYKKNRSTDFCLKKYRFWGENADLFVFKNTPYINTDIKQNQNLFWIDKEMFIHALRLIQLT